MSWTTRDELAFIRDLGIVRDPESDRRASRPSRLSLLLGYVSALRRRVVWGSLHRDLIVLSAAEALAAERRKP